VVANLVDSLHLDGARIVTPSGAVVAAWGDPARHHDMALSFGGEHLGELQVGTRRGESALSRADRQLLDTVTPLIAAVVHADRLAQDLRAERNRVVEATEAERRRLRQDLHDGLGPSLTGIGLGLEAAQAGVPEDDPAAAELLRRLRAEVAASLEETRRIIEDLRPVTLDGADLRTALRRRTSVAADSGLEVRLDAEPLPQLPPDVETAAFRIADEALTNVVRHASATACTVAVATGDGVLRISVTDDGVGGAAARAGGVGLGSMRERAERIGGRLTVAGGPGGGTRVTAELPLGVDTSASQVSEGVR
jgi:signal transduction histidine kinase